MKKGFLVLLSFFIYSCSGVLMKLASRQVFFSMWYLLYFGLALFDLILFAILWQKILSIMPLNKAILYKSVTLVFSLFFAFFIFGENVTQNNIFGVVLIIVGIITLSMRKVITK